MSNAEHEESDQKRAKIHQIRQGLRIVKVVASRSVRGKTGDTFVGMCSTMDSVVSGSGLDLVSEELPQGPGLSMQEARIASLLLGAEVDMAALRLSFGAGDLQAEALANRLAEVRANYNLLLKAMK